MSYTDAVKSELISAQIKHPHCRRALLFGILAARGHVTAEEHIHLPLEGDALFSLAECLIAEQLHREVRRIRRRGTVATEQLIFSSTTAADFLKGLSEMAGAETLPFEKCQSCRRYFLIGIFVACAYVSDPKREYRVEFSCGDRRELIQAIFVRYGLFPKSADRRAEHLLYFRDSTAIEELFGHMGVTGALFSVMEQKMERAFRNEINRIANCEANNIEKTVAVAQRQIELIGRLISEDKLGALSPELQETARLRMENPELSLTRLAAAAHPPMTKSGLNHRLKKLTEAAEALLEEKKGDMTHE